MNITLYNQGSDPNAVNKQLAAIGTYDCNLKSPVDEENPEIKVSGAHLNANYAYIPAMGRYYFLTPITQNNSITVYQGKSDPLMSFKSGLLGSQCVISRQAWHWDLYLPDNEMPIETRTASAVLKFPQNHFSGADNCYILTTIGG
ncbi:MAG: hypothetical protein J6Q24_02945 [Clostridia bacterium]|nr:hypothetical protein [Clostridia bacterium]